MKKFFSLLAAVLFAGSMMADSFTIVFNETGTENDGTASVTAIEDIIASGAEYVASIPTATKIAKGRTGRGIKLGNSSTAGLLVMNLANPVNATSIVVTAMQYKDGEATLKVQDKEDYVTTAEMAEYTYTYATATEISALTLGTVTKRGYIKQVVVNYEGGTVTPPEPTAEYYLVGNFNGWQAQAAYKFAANPNNDGEYMVDAALALHDSIKVIGVLGETTTWYPDNAPNYVIDPAGDYTIYFRPEGGVENWYQGLFYAEYHAPAAPKTCAEIYGLEDNAEVTLNDVTVTYSNGANVWVKDATGAMLVYLPKDFTNTFVAGDVLAGVAGVKATYKGLVELKPSADQAAAIVATAGEAPAPEELAAVAEADVNKYILLKGVAAEGAFVEGTASNINITLGENTYVLRNFMKNAYTFEAGKTYNVKAVVSYYNALQLYFIDAEEILPNGFYLVGNFNEWTPVSAYHFVGNPADQTEFMVNATLAEGDELKVVNVVDNGITAWYPGDGQPNYVVDAAHAGEKTIYFKPDYQEAWAAFGGYFFIDATEIPVVEPVYPIIETYFATTDQWAPDALSSAAYNAAGDKITVTIGADKVAQWQGQVKIQGPQAVEGKDYHFALKMKANNAVNQVTVKWQDNNNEPNLIYMDKAVNLVADTEFAIDTVVAGIPGNGILVLDFGFAHAGDVIEVYGIAMEEVAGPAEPIDITISSLTAPGTIFYVDVVDAYGYWDFYGYNDEYEIEISNISTTVAAGTYTVDELDADYTYLLPAEGDTIHFVAGQVVLSINDGVANLAGQLTGDNDQVYNINLTYKDPVAEQTVVVNIAEGALYDVYATYGLYGVYGTAEDGIYVQLAIWAEEDFAGDFTEEDLDNQYIGSGLIDAEGKTQSIFSAAINVLPGNAEGAYKVTADLLCYNNTLYKVTMLIGGFEGVENVDAAVKAIKRLVNGNVVIEKAGKKYTVNGANL